MNKCTYTALGDSLTNGIFAYVFDGFAFRLARYYRYNCSKFGFNNFGVPGYTSSDLFNQLCTCKGIQKHIMKSDLLTITIGGNDLLRCTEDNYCKINTRHADKAVEQFNHYWPSIIHLIRESLCFKGDIYTITLYNPYCFDDINYKLANRYVSAINEIIKNPAYSENYCYDVVDIYNLFRNDNSQYWTFFNSIFRNPHLNFEGNYAISKAFIKTINQ